MIASSALKSDCRLLGRQCIICPSSESRGRVAGWGLWRFMAPSRALIASFSLGSMGRPAESCDQRGACGATGGWGVGDALTGGSDQNTVGWNPLRRQMVSGNAPQTNEQHKSSEETSGNCSGSGLWVGFHGEREKNSESSGWAADHRLLGSVAMKLWGTKHSTSQHSFHNDKSNARKNVLVFFFFSFSILAWYGDATRPLLVSDYWKGSFLKRSLCWYGRKSQHIISVN